MINLLLRQSASHLLITPNQSLDDSLLRVHNWWLSGAALLAALAFIMLGLWPIAVMLTLSSLALLYIVLQVAEVQRLEEHLIVDIRQLEYRKGCRTILTTAMDAQTCIYVSVPKRDFECLGFELSITGRPSVSIARNISRSDGFLLVESLKKCGLKVISLSAHDELVKTL